MFNKIKKKIDNIPFLQSKEKIEKNKEELLKLFLAEKIKGELIELTDFIKYVYKEYKHKAWMIKKNKKIHWNEFKKEIKLYWNYVVYDIVFTKKLNNKKKGESKDLWNLYKDWKKIIKVWDILEKWSYKEFEKYKKEIHYLLNRIKIYYQHK